MTGLRFHPSDGQSGIGAARVSHSPRAFLISSKTDLFWWSLLFVLFLVFSGLAYAAMSFGIFGSDLRGHEFHIFIKRSENKNTKIRNRNN